MRGKWLAGIVPRNFSWVIKDRLAVSERPGGSVRSHRKVRRKEELLWLKGQHFDRIVSLLPSTHNLHAYDELELTWSHFPVSPGGDQLEPLADLYPALHGWLRSGERILLHEDDVSDNLMGVVAGYLRWSGLIADGPSAIAATERLLRRQMGAPGRQIVSLVHELPRPAIRRQGGRSSSGESLDGDDEVVSGVRPAGDGTLPGGAVPGEGRKDAS
jgi:hypothetical protein